MRLKLTEGVKKFIETLNESDLTKVTITDDAFESDDVDISEKAVEFAKAMLKATAAKLDTHNAQLRIEHPEYFE